MKKSYAFIIIILSSCTLFGQTNFNFNWKFHKGIIKEAQLPGYNDNDWRQLDLPHDWSIEDINTSDTANGRIISGPFDSNAESGKHSGFTVGGTAWYRKHFKISQADTNKIVYIYFDGVYMNSDLWINGHHIGNQPYGYTANWYNLTPYLNYGEKENIIAVEVKNVGLNSRWHSGSGIYRDVTLSIVDKIHFKPWGISVKSIQADSTQAKIQVEVQIENHTKTGIVTNLLIEIIDSKSETIASKTISTYIHHQLPSKTKANLTVKDPKLWSTDTPHLYQVVCTIKSEDMILDQNETAFGIRTIEFDPEKGMFLNGKNIKLKGGALHATNGPLGACAYYRAEERRVELLKKCGFNSIRCAHNPPSKAFLDACDRLGMLVIDETFDVWSIGWLPDDYHKYFNEWWQHDVQNMVLRDRMIPVP
jgi:beta-galactosidase